MSSAAIPQTGTSTRYDEIADFYDGVVGDGVTDPATAVLLDFAGDVRRLRLLDLAADRAVLPASWHVVARRRDPEAGLPAPGSRQLFSALT